MNTFELIGLATGLGFLAGLRLYATALTLGLAIRFGWLSLQPEYQQLDVLANWWVIALSGTLFVVEFLADKIAWLDSIWDAVHTFIRPLGAAAVAVAAVGNMDSSAMVVAGLVTGGAALTSHSMKAMTRFAVNHSPEPFSNAALSLAGDVVVPFGVWFAMKHPVLVGTTVIVIAVLFALLFLKIVRWLRRRGAKRAGRLAPAQA
ncbi:MAG: DUF4126 domain-containing protein [Bryobacteraceae bacterium]|nr:DUF4126 domain-containing protein [Bryobacteraceae bacterium]